MASARTAADGRPVLVFLHGFALDARMWRRQVEAFRRDYRVITVDLPGFGAQAREVGEVDSAGEVARALDYAKVDRAHVVAASYGAAIGVDLAFKQPGRVASLALVAPMLLGRRMGIEAWPRCVALANDGDRTTAAEVWLDDPLFEALRQDEDLFEEVRQIVLDYAGHHWTGRVTTLWNEPDPMARLKEIDVPTLVVSGEADLASFVLMAEAYAKALPNVKREIVQGVGHHLSLEAGPEFNELLGAFLRSVPA